MKRIPSSIKPLGSMKSMRAEQQATMRHLHGRGDPDRAFDLMRKAQAANTTHHADDRSNKMPPWRRK